jgi:hypothetical protein
MCLNETYSKALIAKRLSDNFLSKITYMLLFRHQNANQNRDIKVANRSFQNMSQFKCLGTTVINQNLIQEEINRIEFW